jgi:ribosomal protein L16 Arg81 hydroxylase
MSSTIAPFVAASSRLLGTVSPEDFLGRYLGQEMLADSIGAVAAREIVSWQEINEALERMRVSGKRVRVTLGGRLLPLSEFVQPTSEGDLNGAPLNSAAISMLLSKGATLVVDAVDELFPGVRSLADEIGALIGVPVWANLYMTWGTSPGFDLHWDEHDTWIVQIDGAKHWTVYEPTRVHPLPSEKALTPRPSGTPVMDRPLTAGDTLYMPRGWWHVAKGLGQQSVHITFGITRPTGSQFLAWVLKGLRDRLEVRADIPAADDLEADARYVDALRTHIQQHLTEDALSGFRRAAQSTYRARPRFSLPGTVRTGDARSDTLGVRLAIGARLMPVTSGSEIEVTINGQARRYDARLRDAFSRLSPTHACPISELARLVPSDAGHVLKLVLQHLSAEGVLSLEPVATRG